MRILHYLLHLVQSRSVANAALWQSTRSFDGITRVHLYADYPRHNINADTEQKQLLDHDIIAFQFPMFWYAAPSLLKEWTDLVLEQGFAFGPKGDKLRGKERCCWQSQPVDWPMPLRSADINNAMSVNIYCHTNKRRICVRWNF